MNLEAKIKERKNSLSFVTTNKAIKLGEHTIPIGTDLPVEEKDMIKVAVEKVDFELAKIFRNMCLIIGLDKEFPLFDEYKGLLEKSLKSPYDYALSLGFSSTEKGEQIDALSFFKAAQLFDDNYFVNFNIGRVYYLLYEQGMKEALSLARYYLLASYNMEEKPESAYLLAITNYNLASYQRAHEFALSALRLDLDGKMKDEILEYMPMLEDKVYYERGYKAIINGRYQEGLEALSAISDQGEDNWRVQFFTGVAYRAMAQYQNAVLHLNKARDLNPAVADIYAELANSLLSLGDIQVAKDELVEGLKLFPTDISLILNMAVAEIYDGKFDLAEKFLEQARKLEPEHSDISTVEVILSEQKRG